MKKEELNQKSELIIKIANELQKEFEGLNENQKKLLAYRKIIDLLQKDDSVQDIELSKTDKIIAITIASNFNKGVVQPFLLYLFNKHDKENKKLYKESLISYNKVLENYKKLAEELKIDNSLELSHLMSYMLWNGYFSVTKTHIYKQKDRLLLHGMNSFDVIKGKGVCLAYSELLHNYLTACNKKSSLLNCKAPKDINCNYRPEIERKEEKNSSKKILSIPKMPLSNFIVNKIGNHVVTLIEQNNKLYLYDPTNFFVLNILDENTATLINGEGKLELKPLSTLMINCNSDPNLLFEKMFCGNIEPAFTRKEIIFSFENTMELINSNICLLDDAYNNIHLELEFIDKQIDKIVGTSKVIRKPNKR